MKRIDEYTLLVAFMVSMSGVMLLMNVFFVEAWVFPHVNMTKMITEENQENWLRIVKEQMAENRSLVSMLEEKHKCKK